MLDCKQLGRLQTAGVATSKTKAAEGSPTPTIRQTTGFFNNTFIIIYQNDDN